MAASITSVISAISKSINQHHSRPTCEAWLPASPGPGVDRPLKDGGLQEGGTGGGKKKDYAGGSDATPSIIKGGGHDITPVMLHNPPPQRKGSLCGCRLAISWLWLTKTEAGAASTFATGTHGAPVGAHGARAHGAPVGAHGAALTPATGAHGARAQSARP